MDATDLAAKLDKTDLDRLAENALTEDRAYQDVTTAALVPDDQRGRGVIIAKAQGVIAGLPMCRAVFQAADPSLAFEALVEEGTSVSPGERLALVEGALASILRAERVALNYLQHLSGVASATARIVETLAGTGCRLRDTRKTVPGLRALEKYAVRVGGGSNHRLNLAQGVLIKDNHLAALRSRLPAGAAVIAEAIRLARQGRPDMPIEVEVTTVEEARQALSTGAGALLLDNMPLDAMREVVALAAGRAALPAGRQARPILEASGGITLDNARQIAGTGVDFISVGAITHSAAALDLSLEVAEAGSPQP